MMHITEDTPPDMLAGAMDLTVHLPSGRAVKMSVERSTPMMDLLVQITTSHNLQLSGHILHALGMAPSAGIGDKVLPYKPNTPIGALDTQHIKVVPKNKTQTAPKNVPPGHQPFESTFRLKVHLPRNQLYVTRVSRNVYLEEIMNKVCVEKDLDPLKYELRHPGNLAVLDPKLTLSDYQITEIFVVVKGAGGLAQGLSTSDIMALRKIEEERKQFQAKTGGGVFNLIFRRGKTTAPNGSVSSNENRSISPSDDSRSVTPPGVPPPIIKETPQEKPKPPQRKRRPAPKPPQPQNEVRNVAEKPASQISNTSNQSDTSSKKGDNGLLICHSRNSSDSSGYHEASILSDNCNTSLPRRPRTMYEDTTDARMVNGEHSRSIGNLAKMSSQSKSTTSLLAPGRKKKAAPPPPGRRIEESVEKTSPVVASHPVEANTESISTIPTTSNTPPESPSVHPQSAATSSTNSTRNSISNLMLPTPTKEDVTKIETKSPISIKEETPQIKKTDEDDSGICENTLSDSTEKDELEVENDWQYQLPSPPKGFRDVSPSVRTESSNYEIETIPDSVVTSPELFEKLKHVQDVQSVASDLPSVVSEVEEKEMCNKLTLENLEKRKTLVYNRELATSLKYAQEDTSERKKVINELEDVITNNKTSSILRPNKPISINRSSTLPDNRNLPNFKISTYDGKKEKVNIFEDDTIRSNEKATLKNTTSMENLSFFKKDYPKQEEETFKKQVAVKQPTLPSVSLSINRSESFSVNSHWSPANPVKRSKSQIALNRNKDGDRKSTDGTTLSKSNSLLDVSGLQSVEVMRMIQTKLNSSRDSLDNVAEEQPKLEIKAPQQPEPKPVPQPKPTTPTNYSSRSFQPPSINLCAWSQRPKCEVTLKEDTDYKLGTGTLKTKVNLKSTPSFNGYKPPQTSEVTHKQNGVNIKINGAEPIVQQKSGNVVIKIGGDQKEPERTTNHFQNDVFRKPLGNVNHVERSRPHSIAFDSQGSYAPPIVRAVELKKEFQDLPVAKSITQISGHVESQPKSLNYTNSFSISDKNSSVYLSNEALNKPVFRTKSFNPVVKGFNNNNRATWNAYGTLPGKNQPEDLNTNKNVPFSQSNLRRTDSNKVLNNNTSSNIFGNVVLRNNTNSFKTIETTKPVEKSQQSPPQPPAPPMAKLVTKPAKIIQPTTSIDSKDLLLEEIRSFGGKKGLKART